MHFTRKKSAKMVLAVVTVAASLFVPSISSAPGRADKDPLVSRQPTPMAGPTDPAALSGGQDRTVTLAVNLIWEGRDLNAHNIEALKSFRQEFRSVSMMHFISPAYFAKPGADAAAVKQLLNAVIQPNDHVGLYLAGWKSMTTAAGIPFRHGPTFWGGALGAKECTADCGLEVPVHIYGDDELVRLVASSRDLLAAQGFAPPVALATAGWVASPAVLEAATQAGFRYDFSAVAPELIVPRLGNFPLYAWVKSLWPQTTPHSQPFVQPTRHGGITEYPQSLAAMDYLTAKDVGIIFAEYTDHLRQGADSSLVFPMTVLQESAAQSLPLLKKALQEIFAASQQKGVSLTWLHLPLPAVAEPPTMAH